MLLKLGSLLLVLIITIYCIFYLQSNKKASSITSILFGFSSAVLGFIAIQVLNYHLISSILFAIALSIFNGFLISKLVQLSNWVNTTLSSLIGFVIGMFLGYITFLSNPAILIVDVIYILFVYILLQFSDKLAVKTQRNAKATSKKGQQKKKGDSSTVYLSTILALMVIILALNLGNIKIGVIGQPQKQAATQDEQNNLQDAIIHVTPSGVSPKNTTFKAQTMMKVVINVDPNAGEHLTFNSDSLKLKNVALKKGENMILLDNPLKGSYPYTIEPGNFSGNLIVK